MRFRYSSFYLALMVSVMTLVSSAVQADDGLIRIGEGPRVIPQFYSNEIVKDAPVTARITTRAIQLLHDGNRIIQEDVTQLYRDSAGRVRREDLSRLSAGGHSTVSLSDPTTGENYMINSATKTAYKMFALPEFALLEVDRDKRPADQELPHSGKNHGMVVETRGMSKGTMVIGAAVSPLPGVSSGVARQGQGGATVTSGSSVVFQGGNPLIPQASSQTEVRSLGQKQINGIRVEGTLRTTTIPAGSFGNEQAIIVEKKAWYAPELRMMVMSEEKDPRFGIISYAAHITSTDEPDKTLFSIPKDVRVVAPDLLHQGLLTQ